METPTPPEPAATPAVATPPAAPAPATPAAPAVPPATPAPAPAASTPPAQAEKTEKPDASEHLQNRLRTLEIRAVVAETGLKPEMAKFITASDEAGMRAQAEELKAAIGTPAVPPAPPAPAAGTHTNPPTPTAPTLDERITEAENKGDRYTSLRLKLEKISG